MKPYPVAEAASVLFVRGHAAEIEPYSMTSLLHSLDKIFALLRLTFELHISHALLSLDFL